jgi:hypothetical protein
MSMTIILVAVLAGIVVIVLLGLVVVRANQVNLTTAADRKKPEWMRETPPPQTIAATLTSEGGVQIFGKTPGEKIASPFVEQIEDILHARLNSHPELSGYQIDLGTGPDSGLEIWVNGEKYESIESLPDAGLRQVFKEAIEEWQNHG